MAESFCEELEPSDIEKTGENRWSDTPNDTPADFQRPSNEALEKMKVDLMNREIKPEPIVVSPKEFDILNTGEDCVVNKVMD